MGYYTRVSFNGSVPYTRVSRAQPEQAPVRTLSDVELAEMEERLRQRDDEQRARIAGAIASATAAPVIQSKQGNEWE
jgi:hypothetical protein